MNHTPGPWTAVETVGAGWEIKARVPQLPNVDRPVTIYHALKADQYLLAYAPWVQFPKDYVEALFEANSRLIAAAPDLLAACKAALGAFERNDAINWDDLRMAIEKAEVAQKCKKCGKIVRIEPGAVCPECLDF
jgi:hypothetical protein